MYELLGRLRGGGRNAVIHALGMPGSNPWSRLAGKRVLWVEDNRVNQEVARDLLELVGIRVTTAGEGMQGLRCLAEAQFDAVLMDIHMPVMDGIETTRVIRRDPALNALPIIGLSASALSAEQERCIEAGMVAFVAKPIVPALLYASLERWIGRGPGSGTPVAAAAAAADSAADRSLLQAMHEIEGIDVNQGLMYFMGRADLYCTLLRRATRDRRGSLESLSDLLAHGHTEAACRLLHDIVSVAGSLGAGALSQQCVKLETDLRQGQATPAAIAAVQASTTRLWAQLDAAIVHADASDGS